MKSAREKNQKVNIVLLSSMKWAWAQADVMKTIYRNSFSLLFERGDCHWIDNMRCINLACVP